jgi:hypothetical protein
MKTYRRNCLIISIVCFAIAAYCILGIINEASASCDVTKGYDGIKWGTKYDVVKEKLNLGPLEKEVKWYHAHMKESVILGGIPFNAGALFDDKDRFIGVELVYIDDTNDDGHINCRNSVLMDICGDCKGLLSRTVNGTKYMVWKSDDVGKVGIEQDYSTPGMYSLVVKFFGKTP